MCKHSQYVKWGFCMVICFILSEFVTSTALIVYEHEWSSNSYFTPAIHQTGCSSGVISHHRTWQ